jgi:hypothetical protein
MIERCPGMFFYVGPQCLVLKIFPFPQSLHLDVFYIIDDCIFPAFRTLSLILCFSFKIEHTVDRRKSTERPIELKDFGTPNYLKLCLSCIKFMRPTLFITSISTSIFPFSTHFYKIIRVKGTKIVE